MANLLASRLTVLYGPSGVGKSSLLRAAVAHALRADSGRGVSSSTRHGPATPARARRGDRLRRRHRVERHAAREARRRLGGRGRRRLPHPRPVRGVLPLPRARRAFADELAASCSASPSLRANFLLGIREDALAKLDAFKGRIPNLFANYLRLDHLDRDGGRAAILGPVERCNELDRREAVEVEPELVDAVLDRSPPAEVDVGRGPRRCRDGRGRGSRRRTSSSCWSASGRPSAKRARRFSASRRSGGSAAPSRSCASTSSGRSEACSRRSRTSPRRCSTTSSRRRGRRSRTAPATSRSTPSVGEPRSGPCSTRSAASASCARSTEPAEASATRSSTTSSPTASSPGARAGCSSAIASRHAGGSAGSSSSRRLRSSRWER